MSPEAIDALVLAGVSVNQLAAAVKADAEAEAARLAEKALAKRASAAERQRRKRSADNAEVTPVRRDTALHGVTERDGRDAVSPTSPPKDNNQTPHTTPSVIVGGRDRSTDWPKDGFRRFYDRYPRKKAPQDAERAYRKAERTPGLTFAALMAAVDRLIESDPDPGFIPYPASWLNSGQWADEPDPPPRRTPANGRPNHGKALNEAFDDLSDRFREQDRASDGGLPRPLLAYGGH